MNLRTLNLLGSNAIPVTTPKMTGTSVTVNGITFTCSEPLAYNIDAGTYSAGASPTDLGFLNFSVPIIVNNLHDGAWHTTGPYIIHRINIQFYYKGSPTGAAFDITPNAYSSGHDYPISNILADAVHQTITDGSDWNHGGGGLGATNGINISGLALL